MDRKFSGREGGKFKVDNWFKANLEPKWQDHEECDDAAQDDHFVMAFCGAALPPTPQPILIVERMQTERWPARRTRWEEALEKE